MRIEQGKHRHPSRKKGAFYVCRFDFNESFLNDDSMVVIDSPANKENELGNESGVAVLCLP